MTTEADSFTRTVAVPAWMVRLVLGFSGILFSGAVWTLCIVVHWVLAIQNDVGHVKSQVSAMEVKHEDFHSAINGLRDDVQQLIRAVDVIKAKNGA